MVAGSGDQLSRGLVLCLVFLTPFTGSVPIFRIPNSTEVQTESLESSTHSNNTGAENSWGKHGSGGSNPWNDTLEESIEGADPGVSPTSSTEPIYVSTTTSVSADLENPLVILITGQEEAGSSSGAKKPGDLSFSPNATNESNFDLLGIFVQNLQPMHQSGKGMGRKVESRQDRKRRAMEDEEILLPNQTPPAVLILEAVEVSSTTQECNDTEATTATEEPNESSTEISDMKSEGSHFVVGRSASGMTSDSPSSRNDDDNGEDAPGTSTPSLVTLHQGSTPGEPSIPFIAKILKDMAALDSQSGEPAAAPSQGGDEVPSPIRKSHPDSSDEGPMVLQPSSSKSIRRIPPTEFVGPGSDGMWLGESNDPNYDAGVEFGEEGSRNPVLLLLFISPAQSFPTDVSRSSNSTSNKNSTGWSHRGTPDELLSRRRRDTLMTPSPAPAPPFLPSNSSNTTADVNAQPSDIGNPTQECMLLSENTSGQTGSPEDLTLNVTSNTGGSNAVENSLSNTTTGTSTAIPDVNSTTISISTPSTENPATSASSAGNLTFTASSGNSGARDPRILTSSGNTETNPTSSSGSPTASITNGNSTTNSTSSPGNLTTPIPPNAAATVNATTGTTTETSTTGSVATSPAILKDPNSTINGNESPEGLTQNSENTGNANATGGSFPTKVTISSGPSSITTTAESNTTTISIGVTSTNSNSSNSSATSTSRGNATTNSISNGTSSSSTERSSNVTSSLSTVNSTTGSSSPSPPSSVPSRSNFTNDATTECPQGLTENPGNNNGSTAGTNVGGFDTTSVNLTTPVVTTSSSQSNGTNIFIGVTSTSANTSDSSDSSMTSISTGNATTNSSGASNAGSGSTLLSSNGTSGFPSAVAISVNSTMINSNGAPEGLSASSSNTTTTINSSSIGTVDNNVAGGVSGLNSTVLITGNTTVQTNGSSLASNNNNSLPLNSSTDASTNNNTTLTVTNGSTSGSWSQNSGSPNLTGSNSSIPINLTSSTNETTTTATVSSSTGTLACDSSGETSQGPTTTSANTTSTGTTSSTTTSVGNTTAARGSWNSQSNTTTSDSGPGSSSSGAGESSDLNSTISGIENTSVNATGIIRGRSLWVDTGAVNSSVGTTTTSVNSVSGSQGQASAAPEGILAPTDSNTQSPGVVGNYTVDYTVSEAPQHLFYSFQEKIQPDVSSGSYRVLLPDGRTEVVTYTADAFGYHPVIEYEPASTTTTG